MKPIKMGALEQLRADLAARRVGQARQEMETRLGRPLTTEEIVAIEAGEGDGSQA